MDTVKLYENDSYIKKFTAQVISCEKCKEYFNLVLDKTAFFPEGGGQDADSGTIDGEPVLDVQIKGGVVYHKTAKEFSVGSSVICEIDWQTRFSRMQNHTGEHIVSGVIHNNFGYNNVGFHLSDKLVTLDVDGSLNESQIEFIENEVNRIICENKKVSVLYPTPEELTNIDYRSKLDLTENVRLVRIEDCDLCACCAPHVKSTGEIGIVKILSFIPYKKGTRIEMLAGHLAFEDYKKIHRSTKGIMNLLSSKREDILSSVERIHSELGEIKSKNNSLSMELSMLKLEKHINGDMLCCFTENGTYDTLRFCANSLINEGEIICLFSATEKNEYIYVVASGTAKVQDTVRLLNSAFDGKGGGRDFYAQGKITATKEEIIKLL